MKNHARYIMVGGFLGAGKTTTILQLAQILNERGLKVGLITNDQSIDLVDTRLLASRSFAVEEITGGCFCCKFDSLTEAAQKLRERERPDVFLAEPVGSCTDLNATVSYPLRRLYGEQYIVSPYSVLVDPIRAERILGLEAGKNFSPKIRYIYTKQLEEADIIVINKVDLLATTRLQRLVEALKLEYPQAKVVSISARQNQGITPWLDHLLSSTQQGGESISIDYDIYADGEAELGWLNMSVLLDSKEEFDGNRWLKVLATKVQAVCEQNALEIAHFKMTLTPNEGNDLAVVNLVRTEGTTELAYALVAPLQHGVCLINLRAEADPERLRIIVSEALEQMDSLLKSQIAAPVHASIQEIESFRPGRPRPTHRDFAGQNP